MSQYIYAIIPYESGISFSEDDIYPCVFGPTLPQLKEIESELTDREGLCLFADFLQINTCYRQSAFTNNKDGYSQLRAEVCTIARALGANEAWYVGELMTDQMDYPSFSYEAWSKSLKEGNSRFVVELTREILKGKEVYSLYHDNFSDIIMKNKND